MARLSTLRQKNRRTTLVPVTTMEEIPVLSAREKAELLASLKQAEFRSTKHAEPSTS
jgi:hypothetical protein